MIDQRDFLKYGINKNESGKLENGFMDQIQSQDIFSVMMDLCQMLLIQEERQKLDVIRVKQPRKDILTVREKQITILNQLQFSLQFQRSLLVHQMGLGMVLAVLNH